MHTLNEDQRKAVLAEGNTVVVAAPGSGKTRVITERIGYVLENNPDKQIIAVTFTSDSAEDIKRRVASQYPGKQRNLCIGTFHSHALRQIKNTGFNFQLIDESAQQSIASHAKQMSGSNISWSDMLSVISQEKGNSSQDDVTEASILYDAYRDILKRNNLLDFDDLLTKSVHGMEDGFIRPLSAIEMMIDESQDLDKIQFEWILQHAPYMNLFFVMDDDQLIYAWRNADGYQLIKKYAQKNRFNTIVLNTNYRCKQEILTAAKRLIENNTDRTSKDLRSFRGPGGSIVLKGFDKTIEEYECIVEYIYRIEGNWAVLARRNADLDKLEKVLEKHGIAYTRPKSKSIWDRKHIGHFLNLVRAIFSNNLVGVEQLLLHWEKFIQIEVLEIRRHIEEHIQGNESKLDETKLRGEENRSKAMQFISDFLAWRRCVDDTPKYVISQIKTWFSNRTNEEEKIQDYEMLEDLFDHPSESIQQVLNRLTKKDKKKEARVTLMTLHGSKGLEFQNVWMPRMIEGTLPCTPPYHQIASNQVKRLIEEERRLCYVGMTRAEDNLYLSYSTENRSSPSRFLVEAGVLHKKSDQPMENILRTAKES